MATQNENIPQDPIVILPLTFECDIPMTYGDDDNDTWINRVLPAIVDCPDIPLNQTADFWNCNLCGNDERYEQPMIPGDEFYLQYNINSTEFTDYYAFLFDANDEIIEMGFGTGIYFFQTTDGTNTYLNVRLTADSIPATCFYFKLFAFRCEINTTALTACEEAAVLSGQGAQEARLTCLIAQCDDYAEFYSEMYRKTNDDCEETILIESDYNGKYDCQNRYYGANESDERFILRVRIPGTIHQTDIDFEVTEVNNRRRTSKMLESYLMRSEKIPDHVAVQVGLALAGQSYTVDGFEYKNPGKVSKNFDEGRMWILNVTMSRECNENDFGCEN